MPSRLLPKAVFINCPFDDTYRPLFDAIVFTVLDLEFFPRCALEIDDASVGRLEKITGIIDECMYGIHDISAVGLSAGTNLPRFNMPLELGLFLGCKHFGGQQQRKKACLILDSDPYRYRASMSDISGRDIHSHNGYPSQAITAVRDWLSSVSRTGGLPGGGEIARRYARFRKGLPGNCARAKRDPSKLTFVDFCEFAEIWLKASR